MLNDVDLGEPTSFLDHVYMGCTQRECTIKEPCLNPESVLEQHKSYPTLFMVLRYGRSCTERIDV